MAGEPGNLLDVYPLCLWREVTDPHILDHAATITAEGDQDDAFKLKALRGRKRREFDPDPRRARDDRRDQRDWLDDRLSPSRALASLRRRGFIGVAEPDWGVRLRIGVRLRRGIVLRP